LEVAGLDAEALDEILTRCLPTVRDEQDLLLVLTMPTLARVRAGLEKLAAPAIDNVLDALTQCQDKVSHQIELGLLHKRALMDWGVIQTVNGGLRPPVRTLPDLLRQLQYLPGQVVGTVGKLDEALDTATVDEEIPLLLGRLDERDAEIVRERFSPGKRPTLDELGARFEVSRERVRQIEKQAAKSLRQ
ncbi:MAG: hypothetical protein M3454_01175, partial [Actinomycetota bacterium]|nr:hypothetical protein [Actinomycetota bacterium]